MSHPASHAAHPAPPLPPNAGSRPDPPRPALSARIATQTPRYAAPRHTNLTLPLSLKRFSLRIQTEPIESRPSFLFHSGNIVERVGTMPRFFKRILTELRRENPSHAQAQDHGMQRTRRVLERRGSAQRLSLFDAMADGGMGGDQASSIDRPILAPSLAEGEERGGEGRKQRARRKLSKRQRVTGTVVGGGNA